VVHINAAVAGLVGAYMIGKRVGYGREAMAPHNLTLTMVGASLLWVGWFGFNAGSALEANGFAALAFINTFLATAAAVLAWCRGECCSRARPRCWAPPRARWPAWWPSPRPAASSARWARIVIGLIAGLVCLWGVNGLKKLLGADDSLDVFGVHGVGGIVGALLTGVFNTPPLGGPGWWPTGSPPRWAAGFGIGARCGSRPRRVSDHRLVGVVSHRLQDRRPGDRPARAEEEEREGLDITRTAKPPTQVKPGSGLVTGEGGACGWPFFLSAAIACGRPERP
jgi:Amt family ammonium transporter